MCHAEPAEALSYSTRITWVKVKLYRVLMSKTKIVLLFIGLFILYFLVKKIGLTAITNQIISMGWAFLFLMFFPIFIQYVLFALAWQYSLNGRIPGFMKIFFANIAGDSVSYILPGTVIAGEPLKAFFLRHHAGMHSSTASVIISKTTRAISMVVFVVISLIVFLYFYQMPVVVETSLGVALALLSAGILIFLCLQKKGIFANLISWADFIKLPEWVNEKKTNFIREKGHHLLKLDEHLINFYKTESSRFYFSVTVSIIGWLIGAIEIYFFLKFLGMPVSLMTALAIEALSLVINTCFLFMPAGVGTQEAGKVFIFKMLGMLAETGLTIGLLRRMRELVWTFMGLGVCAFYKTTEPVKQQIT